MYYRKEIDGLRALAVIPVILFHAGIKGFEGGFVGVDIFFVISGYLITSIIINELEAGTFTLSGFYERRARRILPALFFILLICLPVAWWLLLPHEFTALARSIIATVLFSSNILFWQEQDYFSADSELNPLLHTWSLAVEEQFYILFPLLLIACWRWRKHQVAIILAIIAVLSLVLAEWGWRHDVSGNFYLLPGRVWELMSGAICALYLRRGSHPDSQPQGILANLLSLCGIVLLIISIGWFDESIPFPGLYALLPIIGTALIIIFGHHDTLIARVLSLPLLTGIGLISYSAYLWHQPLFAFTRIYLGDDPELWLILGLSLSSFILAWFSWRYIERPFRHRERFNRQQIFLMAFVFGIVLMLLASSILFMNGFPQRYV